MDTLLRDSLTWVAGLGPWGPMSLAGLYILACVLFVPGSALTLGAGALFGVGAGTAAVSAGSTLGATAAFLIGRHLARGWVARKLAAHRTFTVLDDAVGVQGWRIVLLARLSPVFPFNLLNYAFGLTRVSLRDYVLASWIGMLPGTLLYVWIGAAARTLAGAAAGRTRSPAEWALLGVGLAATVAAVMLVGRAARRALAQTLPEAS